ncbi:hypothetical protein CB0940_02542 [Cercospora beticola]|uniref:Heterokaryon incompatibility domain-containing protein n=2 Tax=Cercospora beticola TaxID=122368 RepID=A0A2G5I370_CERBT|nr:hypothetical protein CB0940_02542 [Cercospora beticola]PIA99266.1 hypothetical protein CB0940_02542 [Cercospora beticola]
MAQTRAQAGPERGWGEMRDEIVARPKDPSVLAGVPLRDPSASLYNPLPTEEHIRVLIIQPALGLEDPIKCDLTVVLRTPRARYKALSYSWAMGNGDCSLSRVISVHNSDVAITQNLFEGLIRIRRKRGVVRIWVDALCIDQNDIQEKGSQVAQMYQIYQNAEETLVWLGEDPLNDGSPVEDNDAVLRAIGRLQDIRQPHEIRTFFSGAESCICLHRDVTQCVCGGPLPDLVGDMKEASVRWRSILATMPDLVQYTETLLETFDSFFGGRYWTRRWIVQEYTSKPKTLFWGCHQQPALTVSDLDRLSMMAGNSEGRGFEHIDRVAFLTAVADREPGNNLVMHLHAFRSMQCSHDHDILFSLLSLSNPFELAVDYNRTIGELYREFSLRAVADGYWIFILGNSGLSASRRAIDGSGGPGSGNSLPQASNLDLPTWVADLKDIEFADYARGPSNWITDPQFIEDRLTLHVFFVAVITHRAHMQGQNEWDTEGPPKWTASEWHTEWNVGRVACTGNQDMQHGDQSLLRSVITVSTRVNDSYSRLDIEPGDLLLLPDTIYDERALEQGLLVVRPRSTFARDTRLVVQNVGVAKFTSVSIMEAQKYRTEGARIELEII